MLRFPSGGQMRLYGGGRRVLWLMGEEEYAFSDQLPEDTALISVSGQDWNRDFSPWPAEAVFRGQPFAGGADEYLLRLTGEWMPQALERFGLRPSSQGILGYSLAGLFSLYASVRTGSFPLTASVSGSLWFDGFLPWLEARSPLAEGCYYFSVGDREKSARNPRMARVEECTRAAARWASSLSPRVCFRLEKGGHFQDPQLRLQNAVHYLLYEHEAQNG